MTRRPHVEPREPGLPFDLRVVLLVEPVGKGLAVISQSAKDKLVEMDALGMRDAFGKMEVFEGLLAQSAEESKRAFEAPAYLADRVGVLEWRSQDGTMCYTLHPKSVAEERVWSECEHLLYFHGGGLVMQVGPPHWEFCILLVEKLGCAVTMPTYPLLPTYVWQDAHASVLAAYRGLLQKPGVVAGRIVISGDSAGGLLAITLMQLCKLHGLCDPAAVVTFSPMTDVGYEVPDERKAALDAVDPLIGLLGIREIPKLWVPDESDRGQFPPCVLRGPMVDLPQQWLFAGSRECLLPEMVEYVSRVEEAGSPIVFDVREGMWHTYPLMPDMDEGREALEWVVEILRGAWS